MASSTRFGLFPCTVGSLQLVQIGSVSVRAGTSKEVIIPGGALDAGAIPLNMADPTVTVTSMDFTTILTSVSLTAGYDCSAGATFRYQKRADSGTFSGGGSNVTLTSTKGFAILRSISASQDTPATLDLEYKPLWDQSTLPLVVNNSVDISGASQPAFTSVFYLGPMYVNSTQIPGVISTRIDPGVQFEVLRADGEPYAQVGSIVARRPTIQTTIRKAEYMNTIGNIFNVSPGTTVKWYFAKGAHGTAVRTAAASTVHCKISSTAGAWNPELIDVQDVNDTDVQITYQPSTSLAMDIASAIP